MSDLKHAVIAERGSYAFRRSSGHLPRTGIPAGQTCGRYPEREYFNKDDRIRFCKLYRKNYGGCSPCFVK